MMQKHETKIVWMNPVTQRRREKWWQRLWPTPSCIGAAKVHSGDASRLAVAGGDEGVHTSATFCILPVRSCYCFFSSRAYQGGGAVSTCKKERSTATCMKKVSDMFLPVWVHFKQCVVIRWQPRNITTLQRGVGKNDAALLEGMTRRHADSIHSRDQAPCCKAGTCGKRCIQSSR